MKSSIFVIVLFLVPIQSLWSQDSLILMDSGNFSIISLNDTLDIDYAFMTPFPDTASLDIDCDGVADVRIDMYKVPVMFFPPEHHIDFHNLIGDDLEMLNGGWLLSAFRSSDTIQVEPNMNWESLPDWKLLFFHVVGGANWAGISGNDSLFVNDMYIIFRKKISGEWIYGWINYSGKSWDTNLYLHHFAIEGEYCMSTALNPFPEHPRKISLYPNPAGDQLFLKPDPQVVYPLSWDLLDFRGIPVGHGDLKQQGDAIDIGLLGLADGMYFVRFKSGFNPVILHSTIVVHQ